MKKRYEDKYSYSTCIGLSRVNHHTYKLIGVAQVSVVGGEGFGEGQLSTGRHWLKVVVVVVFQLVDLFRSPDPCKHTNTKKW